MIEDLKAYFRELPISTAFLLLTVAYTVATFFLPGLAINIWAMMLSACTLIVARYEQR